MESFYFYDYETFGVDPVASWPAQFAGIRTDEEFNELEGPLNLYCKFPEDRIPHPESCMITRLTPQEVNKKGLKEPDFIRAIYKEFSKSGTCILGYNTLRFDDEVTRNILYRNFYDPYSHEYKNGNSRWDLIDFTRLIFALRPEELEWPVNDSNMVSLRLEELTKANNIVHEKAHDAISDVRATIAWARLLRKKKPKVFNYVFPKRNKHQVFQFIHSIKNKLMVHISGMYGAQNKYTSVVMPLLKHPTNANGVIVYDLMKNVDTLLDLSVEEIRKYLFLPSDQRIDSDPVISLKTIHANKCPIVLPISILRNKDLDRLKIDLSICEINREKISNSKDFLEKISTVFSNWEYKNNNLIEDPEDMLYSGGFSSTHDRRIMNSILAINDISDLREIQGQFIDERFNEMLFRYRARHYHETLSNTEKLRWKNFIKKSFCTKDTNRLSVDDFWKIMEKIKEERILDSLDTQVVFNDLSDYMKQQEKKSVTEI